MRRKFPKPKALWNPKPPPQSFIPFTKNRPSPAEIEVPHLTRDFSPVSRRNGNGYFASGPASSWLGTQTTPHGLPDDLTRAISLSVARSTTETSSDGPLAANKYFPSGEMVIPHGRVPTLIVSST